jgi:tetratricopeptide (TPR) repeat protein
MILFLAAALAAAAPATAAAPPTAAAPAPARCADVVTPEAFVCRAVEASNSGKPDAAAAAFEQAALATADGDPAKARMFAAAGNMWIAAGEPGKAALALDRALAGTGLQAEQRGEALLDRARAAEAQNDLKVARAKLNEAATTISEDPFYWYFSAALAIRELDKATAETAIGKALSLAPADPTILFEAGHVAHFAGEEEKARGYWTQAAQFDSNGPIGKAARDAIAMLPVPVTQKVPPAKGN